MKRRFRMIASIGRSRRDSPEYPGTLGALEETQREWMEGSDERIRAEVEARFASGEISQGQHDKIMAILDRPADEDDVQTSTFTGPGMVSVRRISIRSEPDAEPAPRSSDRPE